MCGKYFGSIRDCKVERERVNFCNLMQKTTCREIEKHAQYSGDVNFVENSL